MPRQRPLVSRKSRVGPSMLVFPVPRWGAGGAADHVAEPQSSASRVACRCPERPQAVWGVLKSAATLTNRSGEGASCCALYGRRASKHGPRGPEAVVGSGDESSRANATKLRPSLSAVKANQNRRTRTGEPEQAAQIFTSWNQVSNWLSQLRGTPTSCIVKRSRTLRITSS